MSSDFAWLIADRVIRPAVGTDHPSQDRRLPRLSRLTPTDSQRKRHRQPASGAQLTCFSYVINKKGRAPKPTPYRRIESSSAFGTTISIARHYYLSRSSQFCCDDSGGASSSANALGDVHVSGFPSTRFSLNQPTSGAQPTSFCQVGAQSLHRLFSAHPVELLSN